MPYLRRSQPPMRPQANHFASYDHAAAGTAESPARILLVNGAGRRASRAAMLAQSLLQDEGAQVEQLDLESNGVDPLDRCGQAHGIIIFAPPGWQSGPHPLAALVARLSSHPAALADRVYGVVVPDGQAGAEAARHALTTWLDWMGLVDGETFAPLDCFVGYSDEEHRPAVGEAALHEETRHIAQAVHAGVAEIRAGRIAPRHRD